jgi:energy-coupling factor transporter ATP-binding protein EcfA2
VKVGSRVSHEKFGVGEVRGIRDGGYELHVKFQGRWLRRWIKAQDLRDLDASPIVASPPAASGPPPAPKPVRPPQPVATDENRFSARRLVEALRLGIVPPHEVPRFTFGRDDEQAEIRSWLRDPQRNFRLLVGEYGSGKSHFLECIRGLALEEKFAVSLITLEPNESPLYRPKRVYRRLVQNLEYIDAGHRRRGFREFLLDGSQRPHQLWQEDYYLSTLYQDLKYGRLEESRWDWIAGNEVVRKDQLFDDSTAASIYCHLLSAYSVIARDCLGLKGLLLLFDEAEMIDAMATKTQVRRGFNFLRGLSLVAENDRRLLTEQIRDGSVNSGERFGSEQGRIGIETNLRYSGLLQIPFSVQQPVAVKAIFAFAPAVILDDASFVDFDRIEIEPLGSAALKETATEYAKAYAFQLNGTHHALITRRLLECRFSSPRLFIKAGVEALDLLRLYPAEDPRVVLGDSM